MAGPWEKYSAGRGGKPWERYAGAGVQKLSGRVEPRAEVNSQPSSNIVGQDGKPIYRDGAFFNATAGMNSALYATAGAPVDASRNLINWGVAGLNALTGQEDLTTNMIPDDGLGSRKWFADQFEGIGVEDPDHVIARNLSDRLFRAAGEGAGSAVGPGVAFSLLQKAGIIGPRAARIVDDIFGSGSTISGQTRNAIAGATAGLGAQGGVEIAPEAWKPLASAIGGLAGGLTGVGVGMVPTLMRAGGRIAGDYFSPLSEAGRQRTAGQQLRAGATSPGDVIDAIETGPQEVIAGSMPTTGQMTGDMGLLSMERAAATRNPEMFNQRRADQNAARMGVIENMQPTGTADSLVSSLRSRFSEIDQLAEREVAEAMVQARTAADGLGPGATADVAGGALRSRLEAARAAAKQQERALWNAVDPDATLALGTMNTKAAARQLADETPAAAKQPEGEEAAILSVVRGWDDVVPFSEVTALQSRLKAAMREERFSRGESPTYRRMSILNDYLQADLEAVVASRSADASLVGSGASPAASVPRGVMSAPSAIPGAGSAVFTPSGRRLDVSYQLVEADQLVPSNLDDLRPNPRYLADLQPRNRTRTASDVQIARMAGELQPERLGASASASEGAPVVGPDGMVESGNARTLAIRRAYQENGASANAYRQFLASQGYDVGNMRQPVLVRVRQSELSPADRVRFTQEANAGPGLALSASERAATDASRLDGAMLSLLRGNDVTAADNRDFVRAFLGKVAEKGEEGAFVTKDGQLSVEGTQRVRGALMRAAYDDNALVEALLDAGDDNIRVFGRAMADLSGDVARIKAGIREGRIDLEADVSPAMVEAARVVQAARKRGVSLPNALAQRDAFDALSSEALLVLEAAYGAGASGRISRERFDAVLKAVISEAEQQTTDARLFGEPLGLSQILSGAVARYGRSETSPGAVAIGAGNAGPGNRAVRQGVGRPGYGPVGPGSSSAGGGILEAPRPELSPNFDTAALRRLNTARTATRERAETFDNKTLGPLRRRPSSTAPYDVPESAVPGRIFFSGPKSFDAINRFRSAVGPEQADPILVDYAVDRLRRAALKDDGTLDPAKVASWRRSHADALRALPALDNAVADATLATETMLHAAQAQRSAVANIQRGVVGRLLSIDSPQDVTRTIGSIFGRQDAVQQMQRVRQMIGSNAEGREGLRKAVVDHMLDRFVANTEAATSGLGTIKSDQLQSFIAQNADTLRAAGFTDNEIGVWQDLAEDLQHSNRSLNAARIPGQSNTAQDVLAARPDDDRTISTLKLVLASILSGGGTAAALGPVAGVGMALGAPVLMALRRSGLQKVDDLVRDALLNPELARTLMVKATPKTTDRAVMSFIQAYRRAVLAGTLSSSDGDEQKGIRLVLEAMASRPVQGWQIPSAVGDVARALVERQGGLK